MKILSVVGARPQFVKEAAMQHAFNKSRKIEEVLVHTGQHYDSNMSDIFFDTFSIKEPKYNLGITSNLHGEMTGRMLTELEKVMISECPDLVLLYGDTNSTVAGALAASKLKIRVAHVEAGFRQKKPKYMPEEINRVVTDHISDYLFCASELALKNLEKEAIIENAFFSGDVMYDVFLKMKPFFNNNKIKELGLTENQYVIMTLHRDSNVDEKEKLEEILIEVNGVSKELPVVYPIHPRTKNRIAAFGLEGICKDIIFTDPLDYLDLMGLTSSCWKAITDSGGYQKETYFSGKQAGVMMPETGWTELIDNGVNQLIEAKDIRDFIFDNRQVAIKENIYGDGHAADFITRTLMEI